MPKPANAAEAAAFVDTWADAGVAGFKLYRHVEPDIAEALITAAHARNLHVTGHLCSLTYGEAAAMGIDRLEHGLNPATDFMPDKAPGVCASSRASKLALTPDDPALNALIADLVAHDVAITSTLAILESGFRHRPQADARSLAALSPDCREAYAARQATLQEGETTSTPAYWDLLLAFERRFVAAGGRLVAGPDTGRHVLPGFGDQRNLELLVEAGFTVPAAVQIMAHNGALELGIGDDVGLIKPGMRADLLVVPGDLTTDPSLIRDLRYVFKAGVGYAPERLIADVQGLVGLR